MALTSIWERDIYYAPQDITIIGAGLMGLWSALALHHTNPQLRITILERHPIPLGASTRNAGFACFGSPTELLADINSMGADAMLSIVEMRYRGIEKIKSHFTAAQIGLDPCGGYECINPNYPHFADLADKVAWLNQLLLPITRLPKTFVSNTPALAPLGLQNFAALIENPMEAGLHSGKLVQALTNRVLASGIRILYGMELHHWEAGPSQIDLFTHQQTRLCTQQLLFCTNAFTETLVPGLGVSPGRGQIILTSPIPNLPMKGTFHFDQGFYYWRNLGNRILIGGARNVAFEEEATLDLAGSATIRQELENFLQHHLNPTLSYRIEDHWSGIMGFTDNHQPFVKEVAPRVFAANACNGMGVALTPVMAEQVAALLLG